MNHPNKYLAKRYDTPNRSRAFTDAVYCKADATGADVQARYREAVAAGFDAINMDLIAGLPTDTVEGFCRSLDH